MPRTPLQFKQMKDERKLSILECSLPLFAIHGVSNVSIDMICNKAKCSHGLVYHYFKNVEQIYRELLASETYLNLLKEFEINLEDEAYPQIEKIVYKFLSLINEGKEIISFALILISNEERKSFYSSFVKLVGNGQKEKTITGGKPEDIVSTFFFTLKGIYQTKLNQKHSNVRVPSIDNVLNIFRRKF